jgi:hypothetical protein
MAIEIFFKEYRVISENMFVSQEGGPPVAKLSGTPFSVVVPPLEPGQTIHTRFSRLNIEKGHLSEEFNEIHSAHRLPIPTEMSVQAFDVTCPFFTSGLVDELHRKDELAFNGTVHPLVAAEILKQQLAAGTGPLLRSVEGEEADSCNTFLWGSLFILTIYWQPYLKKWHVKTYPIVSWPTTNEESPDVGPNDYGTETAWVQEGRLFLSTF